MGGGPIQRVRDIMAAIASVLDEGDVVSVVEWSDEQSVLLESYRVQKPNDPTLLDLAADLNTGGSTDLHGGLVRAYQLARDNYSANRINRVIMISDGGANTGITDIEIIAAAASDENGEGIYLVGVGVEDSAADYNDELMNEVTDAGKGAYIYIDSVDEAYRIFGDGERFLSVVEVAARDVRMELTMPWYFGMKAFHGEEYSENPEEVEPQHLAPNDAMSYHQIVNVCDPQLIHPQDSVKAKVTYKNPITRMEMTDELEMSIGELVTAEADQLYKGDVIVGYAQALIIIGSLVSVEEFIGAYETAFGMSGWLETAAQYLDDTEIREIAELMQTYTQFLSGYLPEDYGETDGDFTGGDDDIADGDYWNDYGGDHDAFDSDLEYIDLELTWLPIPAGSFDMGCSPGDDLCLANEADSNGRQHRVNVSAFEMTQTEVTYWQYAYFLNDNGNTCNETICLDAYEGNVRIAESDGLWSAGSGYAYHPVREATWYGAKAFCEWSGGRLPSEAEWEYAARARTTERWYCGNNHACLWAIAWFRENSRDQIHMVGHKELNQFGLYDMLGNVWEWNEDCWHENYDGAPGSGEVWSGGDCTYRVLRGGRWDTPRNDVRVTVRRFDKPAFLDSGGFRCARD